MGKPNQPPFLLFISICDFQKKKTLYCVAPFPFINIYGAAGRTRTDTVSLPPDFESECSNIYK